MFFGTSVLRADDGYSAEDMPAELFDVLRQRNLLINNLDDPSYRRRRHDAVAKMVHQ